MDRESERIIKPAQLRTTERMENMPEITEARLKELIEAEEKLIALENMGVDNW